MSQSISQEIYTDFIVKICITIHIGYDDVYVVLYTIIGWNFISRYLGI